MHRPIASLLAPLLLLMAACGGGEEPPTVVDEPTGDPQRVIALAPSAAEVMHFLDLDDRVVGVGDYVEWPPELAAKPRLGGLFNPDFERIVALEPDLAILLTSEESLRGRLEEVGIEVLTVPSDTLGDIEFAVRQIAERLGADEAGEAFLKQWRQDLAPQVVSQSLRVAMVVGREPQRLGDLLVAGPDTFYDQLLSRLGARNVFADVDVRYPQIGIEEILVREPDAVLEIQPLRVPETRVEALAADWSGIGDLVVPCVEVIDGPAVVIPGPRLPDVLDQMRRALESCIAVRS